MVSMAIWQGGSLRKTTGGRIKLAYKKKRFQVGREPMLTTISDTTRKALRTTGGNSKQALLTVKDVNVTDPKTGKTTRAEIKTVTGNPANIHYVRRNIVTKGALIDTSAGKARVTSRPGQTGVVNAVRVA